MTWRKQGPSLVVNWQTGMFDRAVIQTLTDLWEQLTELFPSASLTLIPDVPPIMTVNEYAVFPKTVVMRWYFEGVKKSFWEKVAVPRLPEGTTWRHYREKYWIDLRVASNDAVTFKFWAETSVMVIVP